MSQSPPLSTPPYHQSADDVLAAQQTDRRQGLSQDEARRRLERVGRNELAAKPPVPAWRKFLAQFTDVLVILLIIAAAISALLWLLEREAALPYESLAILSVVFLNALLGYIQESRAEAAVAALGAMSAQQAEVRRDGVQVTAPAAELVPGDIIVIEEGATIPADGRLIRSTSLQTAEAALTGESNPVEKQVEPVAADAELGDRVNMVYSGTAATYGRGLAVVTATGMQTELGRIAGMLEEAPEEITPLQVELNRVGKLLGGIVVAIAVVMIATIILVEKVRGLSALFEVLILGVALAVAAVPEGLPAVVTAVLALGVQRMAKRKAIVRHLAAVETLGSANVIASDKTGTLTKNEMTVRLVATASGRVKLGGAGYEPQGNVEFEAADGAEESLRAEFLQAVTAGERANNASLQQHEGRWTVHGDPTEGALVVAAWKAKLDSEELHQRLKRTDEIPFSSERKVMSTLHVDAARNGQAVLFAKGAPDVLLARCTHELVGAEQRPLTDERRRAISEINEELAGQALRTLGVASRDIPGEADLKRAPDEDLERDLVFLGLVGMIDPPREEAKSAVARARQAGIRPMMITGDHPVTAAAIASELGIAANDRVLTGAELQRMSDDQLQKEVRDVSVYARVDPEHKLRIVKALQAGGDTVAMTGDGVNDAPALKRADIGVAMGITGTDVSKEAADVVLTDDNFATIVAAVEEGRAIFENIRKFLRYLLSSNIGEVFTMFFGVLLAKQIGLHDEGATLVLPLLATQILWINLVTDGLPALALGVDPADEGVMELPPRPRSEGVINREMALGIGLVGVIMATGTLLVLDKALPGGFIAGAGDIRYGQTMAFTTLMMFQLFNVFNARSDVHSAFHGLFRNGWLWGAVACSFVLHLAVIYLPPLQRAFSTTPLAASDWILGAVVASSILWLRELSKLLRRLIVSRDVQSNGKPGGMRGVS